MNENNEIRDEMKAINGSDLADTTIGLIRLLNIRSEQIRGPLLGLGAGMGIAERELAARLGIQDITLVDNDREELLGFSGEYVGADLFIYIQNTHKKYGVVTALGIDYVLHNKDKWAALWSGLKKITQPDSLIIIYPLSSGYSVPDKSMFSILDEGPLFIAQRNH